MDDCIIRVPKVYLNPETVATTRLISLLFVLVHRLNQVLTSDTNSDYPSLYHYRQAASRRATYHVSLLRLKQIFEKELERINRPATNTPVQSTPINQNRRRNPNRRRVEGAVLQQVQFAASLPYKTPKRKIIQIAGTGDENAPPEVCKMVEDCTGMIMKSYPIQYQRCTLCSTRTPWYCPGCKRWLCMDRKALETNQKEMNLYCHSVRGKEVVFNKSCFHTSHERAWAQKKARISEI